MKSGAEKELLNIMRNRHYNRKTSGKIIKVRGSFISLFKISHYLWAEDKGVGQGFLYEKPSVFHFSSKDFLPSHSIRKVTVVCTV